MYELDPRDYVYVRKDKRHSQMQLKQMAIVFTLIVISTLISVLLPIYFANLPVAGG